MLPSSIATIERSVLGRFALYAPRQAGAMTIWRGFLRDPWSPESDLLVAVPRVGNEAIFRLLVAEAGPRIVVEREPLLAVRPAHRGITLAELLDAQGAGSRPPLELLALLARALDRSGLRVQRVTSPHQIIVSWDGDVLVDGLDPIARASPWADDDGLRADVEACLLAAVARGRTDFSGARALVDEVALLAGSSAAEGKRTSGVIERAIIGRYSAALGKGHELDDRVDMAAARAVVATLARELFPERAAHDRLLLEELATMPPDVLERWPQRVAQGPGAPTPDTALMLREATAERALVATETAAFVDDTRRALMMPPRPPRPHTESLLDRFARFLGDLWARLRHRFAAARVPRMLPTSARPAPLPAHHRRGRPRGRSSMRRRMFRPR